MAPVEGLIVNPVVDVKAPPWDPVNCTGTAGVEVQAAAGYVITAEGAPLIFTVVVVTKFEHPPLPGIVYLIVYVPAVAPEGLILPVEASMVSPVDGDTE